MPVVKLLLPGATPRLQGDRQRVDSAVTVSDSPHSAGGASWLTRRTLMITHIVAQLVKNPPATWGTWVLSLGWEDPLEKGKATRFSILAWRIPWTV